MYMYKKTYNNLKLYMYTMFILGKISTTGWRHYGMRFTHNDFMMESLKQTSQDK